MQLPEMRYRECQSNLPDQPDERKYGHVDVWYPFRPASWWRFTVGRSQYDCNSARGLATRLSYLLWRSQPDDELFDLAREGTLSDPITLTRQVDRMLDDPKARRFVTDFAGQAFRLYELRATSPDPELCPEYDDRLAQAMSSETELFLAELVAGNLGAGQLVDADFTFVNRRLAEHYDIIGIEGQQVRKVVLPDGNSRGGLLTQASISKITANGTTTIHEVVRSDLFKKE